MGKKKKKIKLGIPKGCVSASYTTEPIMLSGKGKDPTMDLMETLRLAQDKIDIQLFNHYQKQFRKMEEPTHYHHGNKVTTQPSGKPVSDSAAPLSRSISQNEEHLASLKEASLRLSKVISIMDERFPGLLEEPEEKGATSMLLILEHQTRRLSKLAMQIHDLISVMEEKLGLKL